MAVKFKTKIEPPFLRSNIRFKKKRDAKRRVETQQKELNARSWQTRIQWGVSEIFLDFTRNLICFMV